MSFENVYNDITRADSYARLEFPGTYYLAYRDLPQIIKIHVLGKKAIDFGCGAGRSTRFLKNIGFETIELDVSESMLIKAREIDPEGIYIMVEDGKYEMLKSYTFDLIQAIFTFDNIPTLGKRIEILAGLSKLLKKDGRLICLDSTPEIYMYEWASFSTKDFPENKHAVNGDKVKIIMTDVEDQRPVEDILWTDEFYRKSFNKAGFEVIEIYKPLGRKDEPYNWKTETQIAPWIIYVLGKK